MKIYDLSVTHLYENDRKISLLSLAVPIFMEHSSVGLSSIINTLLVSGYSQDIVTAIGVVGQLSGFIANILMISICGMRVILGIELGRNNRKNACSVMGTAFWMSLVFSLFIGFFCIYFADELLSMMNLYGTVKQIALDYSFIIFCFYSITTCKSLFAVALTCNGYSMHTSFSVIVAQVINIITGWYILYGGVETPFSKATGLALCTLISQLVSLVYILIILMKKKCPLGFKYSFFQMKRILKIGLPASANGIGYTFGQTVTTAMIASLGPIAITAKIYISSIATYISYFSFSIGQAAAILTGRFRGKLQHEKEDRLFWHSMRLAMLLNFFVSVFVFIFRKPVLEIFTDSPEIIALAAKVMFVDIFVQLARGSTNIGDQLLTANGDVKIVSAVSLSACCGVTVLFAWLLGINLSLGLVGCWIAFLLEEIYKSSFYVLRWKNGKWKNQKI